MSLSSVRGALAQSSRHVEKQPETTGSKSKAVIGAARSAEVLGVQVAPQLPIKYDFESLRICMEDGEPDDFFSLMFASLVKFLTIVAEPLSKRERVFERTRELLHRLRFGNIILLSGNASQGAVDKILKNLEEVRNKSVSVVVISPSPTLGSLISKKPLLLAQKVSRIVQMGGFAHRDCELGKLKGKKVYYTTHNLSADISSAQKMFSFAEKFNVDCFVISTDNLRLSRKLNYEIVEKLCLMGSSASKFIYSEVVDWNKITKEKVKQVAQETGLGGERQSMTPADLIAWVFDLAFPSLEIESRGMKGITITDEPRYQKKEGQFEPQKHKAVQFEFDQESTIRYVDNFRLKDALLPKREDFQMPTEMTRKQTEKTFTYLLDDLLKKTVDAQMLSSSISSPASAKETSSRYIQLRERKDNTALF